MQKHDIEEGLIILREATLNRFMSSLNKRFGYSNLAKDCCTQISKAAMLKAREAYWYLSMDLQ